MVQMSSLQRKKVKTVNAEKRKELLAEKRKEYDKLVKGRFEFVDAQGGWIEFNHRYFPDDLIVRYKFIHNEICEIPMGLVKHLNNTYKKIRTFGVETGNSQSIELGARGMPSTCERVSRVRFTPVEVL